MLAAALPLVSSLCPPPPSLVSRPCVHFSVERRLTAGTGRAEAGQCDPPLLQRSGEHGGGDGGGHGDDPRDGGHGDDPRDGSQSGHGGHGGGLSGHGGRGGGQSGLYDDHGGGDGYSC